MKQNLSMEDDDLMNEDEQGEEENQKQTFEYQFQETMLLPETKHTKALRLKEEEAKRKAEQ